MEQNREPRNGPTNIWPTNLWQSRKEYPMEKRRSLQQMVLGKLYSNMQKNEPGPISYTIHKNSKWMKDLNVRQEAIKILEEKTGNNLFDLGHSNFLWDISPEARETKAKMNYWDLIKIKSFSTGEGNNQQNWKVTYRMWDDICKWHTRQRVSIQNL